MGAEIRDQAVNRKNCRSTEDMSCIDGQDVVEESETCYAPKSNKSRPKGRRREAHDMENQVDCDLSDFTDDLAREDAERNRIEKERLSLERERYKSEKTERAPEREERKSERDEHDDVELKKFKMMLDFISRQRCLVQHLRKVFQGRLCHCIHYHHKHSIVFHL